MGHPLYRFSKLFTPGIHLTKYYAKNDPVFERSKMKVKTFDEIYLSLGRSF